MTFMFSDNLNLMYYLDVDYQLKLETSWVTYANLLVKDYA